MVPEHYAFEVRFNTFRKLSDLSLLFCGRGSPVEGHKIGPAIHDYYLVHTVHTGKGFFSMNGKSYSCEAGDSFFIFPGELFSYEADKEDPWTYSWMAFSGTAAGEIVGMIGVTIDRPIVKHAVKQVYTTYNRMLRELRQMDVSVLNDLNCSGYIRVLLSHIGTTNKAFITKDNPESVGREQKVRYAVSFLKTQYAQEISIEMLAEQLGYHRAYFSSLFKQIMGYSPKQYLYRVRMEQAELLLSTTSLTVEEVAYSVGYHDPLYFSKHFHRWRGEAPSVFRSRYSP